MAEHDQLRDRLQRDYVDFRLGALRTVTRQIISENSTIEDSGTIVVRTVDTSSVPAEFFRAHRDDFRSLTRLQKALDEATIVLPGGDRIHLPEGAGPGSLFKTFMRRRQQNQAYYEYEMAAFEPGFAPEQRRLLFAGAVARLAMPVYEPANFESR